MLRWTKKAPRTESIAMKGEVMVHSITNALVSAGCWFTVHPLPDLVWRITVEENDIPILLAAIARKKPIGSPRTWPQMR